MQQLEDKLQSEAFDESDFVGNGKIPIILPSFLEILFSIIDLYVACLRWYRQFVALNEKNIRIYARRKIYLFLSLILPALSILIFFVGNGNLSHSHSSDKTTNQIPTELKGLGHCDTFFEDGCVQIAFTPLNSWTEKVMKQVATYNGLDYDSDSIQGFSTTGDLKVSIL